MLENIYSAYDCTFSEKENWKTYFKLYCFKSCENLPGIMCMKCLNLRKIVFRKKKKNCSVPATAPTLKKH